MSWLSASRLPLPHYVDRCAVAWTRWSEKAAKPRDTAIVALLDALFGNSPYLTEIALQNPEFMTDLGRRGPDAVTADLMTALNATTAAARTGKAPAEIATALRRQKRQFALAVAIADIAGVWPLERITGTLSALANGCLEALIDGILLQIERDGQLALKGDPDAAALTILGMGKLGADELNHSSERQIDAHRGGGRVKVLGHNVKLGRGGIREIEFFAQTQQLIFGGRDPTLRLRATCPTLRALSLAGHVSPQAADEMIEAYGFLRRVEHRLQMIDDHQTHNVPDA